jgi:tRNA(Ile)-lysidine synthase
MTSLDEAMRTIRPGRYIVAVSGGVDSMVLLHLMTQLTDVEIIVVHVNHGIRPDAALDGRLVRQFCESHNISYESTDLELGAHTSEALARKRRYGFLRKCLIKYDARAIVTAHHEDDIVETVLINLLRGTGWRGIAPFARETDIIRPLVTVVKSDIVAYANAQAITWREDTTNTQQAYLRNYVRLTIMPWLHANIPHWRAEIMRYIRNQQALRRTIEDEINKILDGHVSFARKSATSSRYIWSMLPAPEAYELFQGVCRRTTGNSMIRDRAHAALLFIKVAKPGKRMELTADWILRVTGDSFIVEPR